MRPIGEIAGEKLGIPADALEPYGKYKAKIALDYIRSLPDRSESKLILVTAITPTPAGEGKTTTTVGLGDALNLIGKFERCRRRDHRVAAMGDVGERAAVDEHRVVLDRLHQIGRQRVL